MNRKLPRLILILLIVALAVALLACSPSDDGELPPSNNDSGISDGQNSSANINKSQIFAEIKDGLVNAGERVNETTTGTRYVNSSYTLIANSVNIGVEYQANYDLSRDQDSEIMVRIFDYNEQSNTAFVYYVDSCLYVQIGEKYIKIEGFGGTSTFKLFFETITDLDMQHTLFSVDFADNIEDMSSFADTKNITKIILSSTEHNVTIKNINLDQLKSTVNDFIQDNIATIGTRLDAVTNKLMGFDLSDLGRVQVGLFTATEMLTVFESEANGDLNVTDFSLTFAGNQSNNIDTYFFDVNYSTDYNAGNIRLTQFDDPASNNYVAMNSSALHFIGNLFVPSLDQTFDVDIKGNFSAEENDLNEVFIDVTNRTYDSVLGSSEESIFGAIYKEGKLYIDASGLIENYLGDIVDTDALGFPRLEVPSFNMSEELQSLLEKMLGLITLDVNVGGIFGSNDDGNPSLEDNAAFKVLIEKVRSENGVFYITIDKEVLNEVIGESSDSIIASFANSLGLEEGLIRDIIALGYFDNVNLELAWNTLNDDISLTVKNGSDDLFVLTLQSQRIPENGLVIEFPDRSEVGYFDTFESFDNPETINVHVEGTLRTQGSALNDISNMMGLFIGDISGKNSNYSITINDTLYLDMDLWQTGDEFYVRALIKRNATKLVEICSDTSDPEVILINNYDLGVKYKMPRSEMRRLIGKLTQNEALWQFDSIVNALEILAKDANISFGEHRDSDNDGLCDKCGDDDLRDYLELSISPYTKADGTTGDPLKDIFGIDNFIAELRVNVNFEAPASLESADDYVTPIINIVDEVQWKSIYEATWVDTATVTFGDTHLEFKLTFEGESATLVTGKYEYHPEARIFGQVATYRLFFTDTVNGTSVVQALYNNQMTIDPSKENPIPETIEVIYTNGRRGYLAYEIEGFPYNNDNIDLLMGGLRAQDYTVVIGKGSIAERRFSLRLDVLGRNVKVDSGNYYNNIPIVAKVTIDPYEYSINKRNAEAEGKTYYPFKYRKEGDASGLSPETLVLAFYAYTNSSEVRYVYLDEFDWGFDEKQITFAGGEYTIVQKYQTLDIAIVIIVQAKHVEYVQINDEDHGYYTVDSLVTSTYTIPTETTEQNEVRIYFTTGHYRIIGTEPQGYVNKDPLCDGYYDKFLDWSIKEANNVTIDRSIHPLDNGKTNKTVCAFGDDTVGKQNVTLTVVCPTRVIGTRADTTLAITSVHYDSSGVILDQLTTYEAVKVSLASFIENGNVANNYFEFDPYSNESDNVNLPNKVYVRVVYEGKEQLIGYTVKWLSEGANIVDDEGHILNAFTNETYLRVRGVIGDGELTQTLEMIIHNKSSSYQNVLMYDSEGARMDIVVRRYNDYNTEIPEDDDTQVEAYRRYFLEGLNPYDIVDLPDTITLQFPAQSGIEDKTYTTNWYLASGESAEGYITSPSGGIVTIYTDVQGDAGEGLLTQTIELSLSYDAKNVVTYRIYGVSDSADAGSLIQQENGQGVTVHYVEVDTYDVASQELYDKLYAGLNTVGIGFIDGTRSNDIDISWINMEEFLSVLQSPLGSSTYYNNGAYEDDIIFLRGIIRKGTVQEQEIRMGFKVFSRVLGDLNFANFDELLSLKDENGVQQVQLVTETKRAKAEVDALGNTTVTMEGKNIINITFNKFYALKGEYENNDGILVEGLTTPSQYIKYLFSNVALSFADAVRVNDLEYELRDDFDDLIYGNATTTDTDVTINDTHVIIRFKVTKLSNGSCAQPFDVTLTYLKDYTEISEDDAQNESIEVFDENGYPLYETNDGYVLDTQYTVKYVNSGYVTYDNLVWYADETVSSLVSNEVITQGAIVKNIKYEFFNFTSTRTIKLHAELPNGQKFKRYLNFYSKNVSLTNYTTENEDIYKIVNGTLEIENVYDYLPLDNFIDNIPTTIVPNQTATFISGYDIKFTLSGAWVPNKIFAEDDDPTKFSIEKLSQAITSSGYDRTLLATNSIVGYNGETQVIQLYFKVKTLSSGQISHDDYPISSNELLYDQYVVGNDGVFILPKDIKVTFGDVFYEFSESDNVKYEIRSKEEPYVYTPIDKLTYNNLGHTMSSEYGYEANDGIFLRITLPDGNDKLRLKVTFPNRKLEQVYYESKLNNTESMMVDGIYYIDPYDSSTFDIPTEAHFKYEGSSVKMVQKVNWTLSTEGVPFIQNIDGSYTYTSDSDDYNGASYLFYSSLKSFDDVDKEQIFIMQVFVLNRSIATRPSEYGAEYYVENPFAARVQDLPSTLEAEDFYDLSTVRVISDEESVALTNLYGSLVGDKKVIVYYEDIYNDGVSIYNAAFVEALSPVIPSVVWKKSDGSLLLDDDIDIRGGFNYTVYGYLGGGEGADRSEGEVMEMVLCADTWEFKAIADLVDYVVEFNDYTMVSILDSFTVLFNVTNENGVITEKGIVFYPEYYATDETKLRTVIVWNKNNWADNSELGSVTFRNEYKVNVDNTITTFNNYKFDAQMVGIDEISFGFGSGYASSGNVELVIDPLNPIIPTTAMAKGKLQTDKKTEIDLGEVNIEWLVTDPANEESIYNINIAGATKDVECKVTSQGQNTNEFPFIVRVTYLNRVPDTISTQESGYTNVGIDNSYYPLLRTTTATDGAVVKNYTFVVDPTPTDSDLFNADGNTNVKYPLAEGGYANSKYTLPSTLRITFENSYDIGSIGSEGLTKLGAELYLYDIEWIISRDITLVGTAVEGGNITAKIRKFRVQYVANGQTNDSDLYDFVDADTHLGVYLNLILTTTNRQVEYTYINENGENKTLSEIPKIRDEYGNEVESTFKYQEALDEFYIDPYNISFPEDIYVVFSSSTIPYHATDIEWTYDEGYLSLTEVITGKMKEEHMFIMASFTLYGTTLEIQFPIRARDIPTSVLTSSGEYTTEPLKGGTLYVLKGKPVEEQLPTRLYYRFDYSNGTTEVASVPLTFPPVSISTINTQEAGKVYSNIKAKLGTVDDDNIVFTVIVIDPKLFMLRETVANSQIGSSTSSNALYANGGYIYDYVAIGVNAAGVYVAGPETSILPDKVIISDAGDFMDIINIEYDIENLTATVYCRYTFLSFSDSSKLSGDADITGENKDKMYLSFTVPIKTYAYNTIETTEARFERAVYEFDLGTVITASDMPLTVDGIAPIWELGDLNTNRAGEYVVTCHFKNAYGKIITGQVTIVINKRNITSEDFTWVLNANRINFRNRIYTGEELRVEDFLEFGTFLREDGTYGMLEGYTIMYSIDGRQNWQPVQPVSVKEDGAPDYFVRIIINESDDYNYTGNVDYNMIIEKCVIVEEDIYFHMGDDVPIVETDYEYVNKNGANSVVRVKQANFEYDGSEKIPFIGGIPKGATYSLSYAIYDPENTNPAYNDAIRPVNTGSYIMRMRFTADQRNYSISNNAEFIIIINITKKNVVYSLIQNMPYTGDYFDVTVNGLPAVLGDVQVDYSYFSITDNVLLPAGSKVRDAGSYQVTVSINGGTNYPSANITGNFTVEKRKVILSVNTVSSEYLEPLKPLNSAITIVSATNPDEQGLVGRYDTMAIFGDLAVAWTGGTLTYKHMVGSYQLALVDKTLSHKNYDFVVINDGVYNIIAEQANTRVISDKAELDEAIGLLTDGATARWYLKAGHYGTITINKNASISIIGSYDITAEEEIIAVAFDQIIVERGAVLIDIIAFKDKANTAAVTVGKNANSLTVSRCEFVRSGTSMLTNSSAISAVYGYKDTIYVSDTYFNGYATALYLQGGNAEVNTSRFYQNMNGIYVQSGNLTLNDNHFVANRGVAVNIAYSKATLSIFDNNFNSNDTAIKTIIELRNDIHVQNVFTQNSVNFDGWQPEE